MESKVSRAIFLGLGWFFLILAAIGVVVPLLPTAPILILASFCFARSSKRLHDWLHRNKWFGPILHNWERNKSIPRRAKVLAVAMITVGITVSLLVLPPVPFRFWLSLGLIAVGCAVSFYLITRPEPNVQ
jgi:uncharacterized protein